MPPVRPMTTPRFPAAPILSLVMSRTAPSSRPALALALGAGVGAPACKLAANDGGAAPPAGLAGAAVDVQIVLELAGRAAPVDVVPHGGERKSTRLNSSHVKPRMPSSP